MKRSWQVAALLAALAAPVACASKPKPVVVVREAPRPKPVEDLVVLLPDEGGTVGRATVSNQGGGVDLDEAREASRIAGAAAPSSETLSDSEVRQIFGETLAALPLQPQHFIVYFRFESQELTPASRAALAGILLAVKDYPAPEVSVIGHTDTTGAAHRNLQLGLSRARTVRDILIANGLTGSAIEVLSYGEADLLVHTADEVFEARNRRVEITVR